MKYRLVELIREHASALEPVPTHVAPRLRPLEGIRAVLFDVYGTLFVSGSGDIGAADAADRARAFVDALAAVGLEFHDDGSAGVERLHQCILSEHERLRREGVPFPEVDVVEIWQQALNSLKTEGTISGSLEETDWPRLAVEYEMRTNPVWPMPDCAETLQRLQEAGFLLGLVSNAQFFTPLLFPALLGKSRAELGFDDRLQWFSYQHRRAKPGTELYELARETLQRQFGVAAEQTLYVGNDKRNDVAPAARVGFRTALFAGDRRSLRLREDDPTVADVEPDLVVTTLLQLVECLERPTAGGQPHTFRPDGE